MKKSLQPRCATRGLLKSIAVTTFLEYILLDTKRQAGCRNSHNLNGRLEIDGLGLCENRIPLDGFKVSSAIGINGNPLQLDDETIQEGRL
jgi:hypothetical protein